MNRRSVLDRLSDVAAVAMVAGAAPVRRVAGIHQGVGMRAGLLLVGVVLLALITSRWCRRAEPPRRWTIQAGAAVACTALLALAVGGRIVGVWTIATATLALWTVPGFPVGPLPQFDRQSLPPVVGLSVAAGVASGAPSRLWLALALSAAAWGVALVGASRGAQVARATETVTERVTQLVGAVALGLVWLPFVLLPWLLERVVRVDPLQAPSRRSPSTFVARAVSDPEPLRAWFVDPAAKRPPLWRRVHAKLPSLLVLSAILAGVWWTQVRPIVGWPGSAAADPAVAADGDLDQIGGELASLTDRAIAESYLSQWVGVELTDMSSELLNIVDGRRRTWQPPECAGEPVTVWMFGGSTTFGVNQVDERTVASALAQLAWERDVRLQVENFGVPGDVTWQMNRRLERALASGERPDVVIYFDGWNDLRFVADMDYAGRNPATQPDFIGPLDRLHLRALGELGGVEPGRRYLLSVPELGPALEPEETVRRALQQYSAGHASAVALARQHGLAFVHVYQPSVYTREPRDPSEPAGDARFAEMVQDFRSGLPDGVEDVSDALDGLDGPVYVDEVHTTGNASRPIADRLWERSQEEMTAAAERRGATSCR